LIKGTVNGTHPKSMTGCVNGLKLRCEDRDAKHEAYADLEKVRYEGFIRDVFIKIQTLNDKAMVTGAALNIIILERLPQKILEQINKVDLSRKTDQEIITIITNAGRTAEKWAAARKHVVFKASLTSFVKEYLKLERRKDKKHKLDRYWVRKD
jgi:hypothetical protein